MSKKLAQNTREILQTIEQNSPRAIGAGVDLDVEESTIKYSVTGENSPLGGLFGRKKEIDPYLDTDGDGIPDWIENREGWDENDPNDPIRNGDQDTDSDGIKDGLEGAICLVYPEVDNCPPGEPPTGITLNQDTDGDGWSDVEEFLRGTDPTDPDDFPTMDRKLDSDSDGIPDWIEIREGWDRFDSNSPVQTGNLDSDSDGIKDGLEGALCIVHPQVDNCPPGNPPVGITKNQDTDGDGYSDIEEFLAGTDPLDPNDYPGDQIRALTETEGDSGSQALLYSALDSFLYGYNIFRLLMTLLIISMAVILTYIRYRTWLIRRKEARKFMGIKRSSESATETAPIENKMPYTEQFAEVTELAHSEYPSDWRRAILSADAILEAFTMDREYRGQTTSERLENVKPESLAHHREISIAHRYKEMMIEKGMHFNLTREDFLQVLSIYKEFFESHDLISKER